MPRPRQPQSPFRYFNSPPEAERGIDISHEIKPSRKLWQPQGVVIARKA